MTISLIHPSRGRSKKSAINARHWITSSGLSIEEVQLIVSIDDTDNYRSYYQDYDTFMADLFWTDFIRNPNQSVVEASNLAAKICVGDILIYLSDDFKCPDNWGQLVINEFKKYSGPTLIKVDDCLQPFNVKVLTIPIMNRALYEKLGYFWHPEYKSQFVDEDLYWTAEKLGALKLAPHLKFPHEHVSIGKADNDETYRRSAANWDQGKALFAKRKAAGFPL
jgi:hypothetical protein